jgi:hypothetical protein
MKKIAIVLIVLNKLWNLEKILTKKLKTNVYTYENKKKFVKLYTSAEYFLTKKYWYIQ